MEPRAHRRRVADGSRSAARCPLPVGVQLDDYETPDGRQLGAVRDELTLTYSVAERGAGGRTRTLRRHADSLRDARRGPVTSAVRGHAGRRALTRSRSDQ